MLSRHALIRSAKPANRPRKLSDSRGLHLLVTPNGGRYWRFSYRFNGKQKTLSLGVYPDVGLAKARARHLQARQLLADGFDPCTWNARRAAGKTFETLAREWHTHWMAEPPSASCSLRAPSVWKPTSFLEIGSRPDLRYLRRSAFRNAVQKIERRGAVDIAKRVLQTCGQITRHAVANDLITQNPVADYQTGGRSGNRTNGAIILESRRRSFRPCCVPSMATSVQSPRAWHCNRWREFRAHSRS